MDAVLEGDALWLDIDDWIDRWHETPSGELHDFLGLTWGDYRLWVEKPESLQWIIAAYDQGREVGELVEHAEPELIAARNLDPAERLTVIKWLKRTKRI
jgi:hypothetical protein